MDREEYREQLARDVATWRRDGLLSAAQEQAILARVGAGEKNLIGALRLGWLVTAVAIVAAIVLGAGVILLFAANWNDTPRELRVGALIAGIVLAYGVGYALTYRFDMRRVGSAFLLLGVIIFQASIFLVAKTYDMAVDSPTLWLLAALGTIPLAYMFSSRIVLLLGIADLTGWVVAQMLNWYPDSPKSESALLVLSALAVALYGIGRLHGMRKELRQFGDVYAFSGLIVLFGLVYAFTFTDVWHAVVNSHVRPAAAPPVVYVALALGALLVAVQLLVRPIDQVRWIELVAEVVVLGLAAIVATWPVWVGYAAVFNGVYFLLAAALVVRGYLLADEPYINLGLGTLALGLLTRYVDIVWSQVATSAFFIVGGLLLFAVAIGVERLRRSMLNQIRDHGSRSPGAGEAGAPI